MGKIAKKLKLVKNTHTQRQSRRHAIPHLSQSRDVECDLRHRRKKRALEGCAFPSGGRANRDDRLRGTYAAMATGYAAVGAPAARAHPRCFSSSPGVRAVGERAWSTRLPHVSVQSGASGASGVSSRHAKRGGAAPAAASPRWWDVKARLETALRGDERSEFGYLEHDSEGETVFRARSKHNGDVRVVKHGPWRSLRFNEVEQGLSYVRETHRDEATGEVTGVTADVDVLGYEYLRCMTAAAAAMCALDAGADWRRGDARGVDGDFHRRPSVVCVGLGLSLIHI